MQAEAECELSEDGTPVMEAVDKAIYCLELASETCPPTRLYEEVQLYLVDAYIMKHRLMSCDSPYLSSAIEICRERCSDRDMDTWLRYDFAERFVDLAKEFKVHLLDALVIQVDIIDDIVSLQYTMPDVVIRIEHSELSQALETAADYCFTVGAHDSALRGAEERQRDAVGTVGSATSAHVEGHD